MQAASDGEVLEIGATAAAKLGANRDNDGDGRTMGRYGLAVVRWHLWPTNCSGLHCQQLLVVPLVPGGGGNCCGKVMES